MPDKFVPGLLLVVVLIGGGAVGMATLGGDDDPSRQEAVAQRGARVMPFSLDATTHVFDATGRGGTQRVVAKDPDDTREIGLIREHLRDEARAFGRGNFADPASIHGADMPGLRALPAGYRDIDVRYRELSIGAEIAYGTDNAQLAAAVRAWFDAQLRDHAGDAAGLDHSGTGHGNQPDHAK